MALDEVFASSIIEVRATFGFEQFGCDPDEITTAIGIEPDEIRRRGARRQTQCGRHQREIVVPFNTWCIASRIVSKDVNDHLRELLSRLDGRQSRPRPDCGPASFSVLYRASHFYSGCGPFFEADVVAGIAAWNAELWQELYQVDDPEADVNR